MSTGASPSGRKTKAKAKAKAKTKTKKPTQAERADRHVLYQSSVQVPEGDIAIFEQIFRSLGRRKPLTMREDFCGTAYLSTTWVKSDPKRRAVGIDLDEPTLEWGRQHNLSTLTPAQRKRITLHQADVLDGVGEKTEFTCALNFSYQVFKTRELLRRYFERVRDCLTDDGVFITELYGGTEAVIELEDERQCKGFVYVWEQASYNPITHDTLCHIHYRFPDRSRLKQAFTYDWRLWTIPELRELLQEAGFREVQVWWEGVDEDGEGSGDYQPTECEENQESWLVYIVAIK
ncbi:MAG: class I SAM-dependent methyltransferase [Deltaproteobacteria bacterium]|nr:class I SAM-dependent methyltransferase [Deltaproteobacteria bacterium]MBK8713631.1 class I SAM-dependent methyltransferase [Deltaproteobacteria bacterium]